MTYCLLQLFFISVFTVIILITLSYRHCPYSWDPEHISYLLSSIGMIKDRKYARDPKIIMNKVLLLKRYIKCVPNMNYYY